MKKIYIYTKNREVQELNKGTEKCILNNFSKVTFSFSCNQPLHRWWIVGTKIKIKNHTKVNI